MGLRTYTVANSLIHVSDLSVVTLLKAPNYKVPECEYNVALMERCIYKREFVIAVHNI